MPRSNAKDRRMQVITVAIMRFAHTGYEGTTTSEIARQVGVSQPYLFQLFPTKKAIFIAAWNEANDRIMRALTGSLDGVAPDARVRALADTYDRLVTSEPDLLTIQLHAWSAASSDVDIARATRAAFARLRQFLIAQLNVTVDDANCMLAKMAFYNITVGMGTAETDGCSASRLLHASE